MPTQNCSLLCTRHRKEHTSLPSYTDDLVGICSTLQHTFHHLNTAHLTGHIKWTETILYSGNGHTYAYLKLCKCVCEHARSSKLANIYMYISWGEVLKHLVTNIGIGILLQQQLNYAKMTSEGSTKECCIPILHKTFTRYAVSI